MELFTKYYRSPVGPIVLQSSDSHVTAVLFSEEPVEDQEQTAPLLETLAAQLDAYFNGGLKQFTVPMQQQGTPFQKKVWELLLKIPYGRTVSYQGLSKQYGDPKAIRAVASANGKNNLSILVPCHRVIGSDQSLTGYAGGLWRKKWLLEHEAKHERGVQELGF